MGYWVASISGTAVVQNTQEGGFVIRVNGVDMAWCAGTTLGAVSFSGGAETSFDPREYSPVILPDGAYISSYSITASYVETNYSITCSASSGGTLKASKTSATPGTTITLTPTPSTGYEFTGYSNVSPSSLVIGSNNKFTMPSAAVKVKANFAKKSYTITKKGSPTAGGVATTSKSSATMGTSITLGHTDNTGYAFSSYTVKTASGKTVTVSNGAFTMPAENVTVTANFTHTLYAITKKVTGGGSFTAQKSGSEVTSAYYNDTIALAAMASEGYRFKQWVTSPAVDVPSSANGNITMPAAKITITAVFEKIPYDINLSSNPSEGGSVSTDHGTTAVMDDVVTLSNTPNNGYLFTEYTSPDVTITDGKFTMPANAVSVQAVFHIGRSAGSLDKTEYTGGETAVLTIVSERSAFSHKYRLNFGTGMDTGFVSVPAGVSSVSIPIPAEWAVNLTPADDVGGVRERTGGVLTLQTFNGNTLFGEYEIEGIVYKALNNVVPRLDVWRVREHGSRKTNGKYAAYAFEIPDGASAILQCGTISVIDPEPTGILLPGDEIQFDPDITFPIKLFVTIGEEEFILFSSVPGIQIVTKDITHIN